MRLVECVPNFSEGRNEKVINAVTDAIKAVEGVNLLDVDPGWSTNRTVVTFVGAPDACVEAAFQAISVAGQLIDMRKHKGEHPRMGATRRLSLRACGRCDHGRMCRACRASGQESRRAAEDSGLPLCQCRQASRPPEPGRYPQRRV